MNEVQFQIIELQQKVRELEDEIRRLSGMTSAEFVRVPHQIKEPTDLAWIAKTPASGIGGRLDNGDGTYKVSEALCKAYRLTVESDSRATLEEVLDGDNQPVYMRLWNPAELEVEGDTFVQAKREGYSRALMIDWEECPADQASS